MEKWDFNTVRKSLGKHDQEAWVNWTVFTFHIALWEVLLQNISFNYRSRTISWRAKSFQPSGKWRQSQLMTNDRDQPCGGWKLINWQTFLTIPLQMSTVEVKKLYMWNLGLLRKALLNAAKSKYAIEVKTN